MKLRLTQAGFESYTGQMGVVFFEDGLSADDVLLIDGTRMAAVMGCEWEDGSAANVNQIYLDNMNTPAPDVTLAAHTEPEASVEEAIAAPAYIGVTYTETQLADIADAQGIAGLRDIAESLGIKGNSIRGLIDAIIKAAGGSKAA